MPRIVPLLAWFLLAAYPAETAAAAAEVLVVAAGEELRLAPAEPGAVVEAAFDGGLLRPVADTLAAPTSGDHTLAVASRDAAGNLSSIRWLELRVDDQPPRLELVLEPPPFEDPQGGLWLPPGATVTARAADDLAGVEGVSVAVGDDPRRQAAAAELTVPLPAAGAARIAAAAVDRVGNRGPESTLTLAVDPLPPGGEVRAAECRGSGSHLAGPGGGLEGAVLAPDCALEAEVTDAGSGVAAWTPRSDGEEVTAAAWEGPWSPGRHSVEAVAVDRVGNEGVVGPYRFVVDGEGPEIRWRVLTSGVAGPGGETCYLPPVEVTAEAEDEMAGLGELAAAADAATFEPVAGPVLVAGDRLALRARDRVGNVSTETAAWRLDRRPPEIRLAAPGGAPVAAGGRLTVRRGEALEVVAGDDCAGIARATSVMNRGWVVPPRARPLGERIVCRRGGRFTLTIEAEDGLGNAFRGAWEIEVRGGTAGD